MQHRNENSTKLSLTLGALVEKLRQDTGISKHKFSCEYEIDSGHFYRIEKGTIDCKVITFYKIAQAFGLKPSKLMKMLEDELGEDFTLIDE